MTDSLNEDNALIGKALGGDREAFDALIEKYYDMMFSLAFKWSGNREDAEDITHNAFLKVADNLRRFKFNSSFKTWLYRIVVNTAHDWHRKRKKRFWVAHDTDRTESQEKADDRLAIMEIVNAVRKLPPRDQEVIMLVSAQGLTHAEAAEIMGCKENTVSWHLHEARKKLDKIIDRTN